MLRSIVMSQPNPKGEQIRRFVLQNVDKHPTNIVQVTAAALNASQQTVNKHLSTLVKDGMLLLEDNNQETTYELKTADWDKSFKITSGLSEDVV